MNIRLHDLSLAYGDRTLLRHADAAFGPATLSALIGRNGSGKSTLLRAVAGLGPTAGGSIELCGKPLEALSVRQRATAVAFVSTERVRIADLTCEEVVALGRAPYTDWIGHLHANDRARIREALEWVGMTAFARTALDRMSDGECQRVLIARALAQDTPVILLDEPTAFLDLPNRYELAALLRRLAHERGKCILFSTHDLDIALALCDTVALLDPPELHCLPAAEAARSGRIERLFAGTHVRFDAATGTVRLR